MKRTGTAVLTCLALAASAAMAGTRMEESKYVAPPEPEMVDTWYVALFGGVTIPEDDGRFDERDGPFRLSLDADNDVGGFGGLKLGYMFPTGRVRPVIELEGFYNGFESSFRGELTGPFLDGRFRDRFEGEGELHSGVGMVNFFVKFDLDWVQPYLGGGIGYFYAETDDVEVEIDGDRFELPNSDDDGLAWQLVGGFDVRVADHWTLFAEYKFLNYEDTGYNDDDLRMHLVGGGVRFHW